MVCSPSTQTDQRVTPQQPQQAGPPQAYWEEQGPTNHYIVSIGSGLPALTKKTVERTRANEYINFLRCHWQTITSVNGRTDHCGAGSRHLQDHSRSGYLVPVLCPRCSNSGDTTAIKIARSHMAYQSLIEPEVHNGCLGGLRPKLWSRGSRQH